MINATTQNLPGVALSQGQMQTLFSVVFAPGDCWMSFFQPPVPARDIEEYSHHIAMCGRTLFEAHGQRLHGTLCQSSTEYPSRELAELKLLEFSGKKLKYGYDLTSHGVLPLTRTAARAAVRWRNVAVCINW